MKIYPFSAADNYLSNQALEKGLDWIREIRDKAGNQMDICVDCWGRFDFPSAARIANSLEPYHIMYLEDAMLMNTPQACARYLCSIHLCAALPNFLIMESNYWKYTHQFPYFVSNVPVPEGGSVAPPEQPGIGAAIKPELFRNGDAMVETVARL
jgi:L-alanine-DL-glutamate epimerase-like enolase superfamily enzyme